MSKLKVGAEEAKTTKLRCRGQQMDKILNIL